MAMQVDWGLIVRFCELFRFHVLQNCSNTWPMHVLDFNDIAIAEGREVLDVIDVLLSHIETMSAWKSNP